jgi:hypothetical protein
MLKQLLKEQHRTRRWPYVTMSSERGIVTKRTEQRRCFASEKTKAWVRVLLCFTLIGMDWTNVNWAESNRVRLDQKKDYMAPSNLIICHLSWFQNSKLNILFFNVNLFPVGLLSLFTWIWWFCSKRCILRIMIVC